MNKNDTQRGDAITITIITALVITLMGAVGYIAWKNITSKDDLAQTSSQEDLEKNNKKTPINNTEKTTPAEADQFQGWKTVDNTNLGVKLRYPSDWPDATITADGSVSVVNHPATSGLDEYVSISLTKESSSNVMGSGLSAADWYNKLGKTDIEAYPITYSAGATENVEVNGLPAKKVRTQHMNTMDNTFILKDGQLYGIYVFSNITKNPEIVDKIISSFTLI